MKKTTLKTLLLGLLMTVGASSAWAQETLYERGYETAWATTDVGDGAWSNGTVTEGVDGNISLAYNNSGIESAFTLTPTEKSIVTLEATITGGGASGRDSSYDYIGMGGIMLKLNAQNKTSFINVDGTDTSLGLNGRSWSGTVKFVIDQATGSISYDIAGKTGTAVSTTAISNIKIGHFRGGRENYASTFTLSKIKVTEEVQTVETADYKVVWAAGGTTIKEETRQGVIGTTPVLSSADVAAFMDGEVKYVYESDDLEGSVIAADGSTVITINYHQAATYNYTVVASDGENVLSTVATGTCLEEDVVTVPFSQYQLSGTTLYNIAANSGDWYRVSFTPIEDNYTHTLSYTNGTVENVVFFTEAENIEGVTTASYTSRASNGAVAYAAESKVITTLEPGKYQIFVRGVNGNAASRALKIKANGTEVFAFDIANGTNQTGNSEEFSLGDTSELTFTCDGSSASGLDWLYIVKTGDVDVTPYTVKYVSTEGNELKESTTHTGFSGEAITLAETDKETIWVDDVKYIYASDDAEGKTAVEGTVVTITFRVAENKPYTIVAVDAEGATVATVAESTVTEGETTSATFSKYVQGTDGTWYELAAPYKMDVVEGENKVVCTAATADFDYFYEAEGLKTTRSAASFSESTSLSNSYGFGMAANHALYTKEAVPAGVYTIYASGLSRRSGSTNIKLNLRDAAGNEIETGKTLTWTNADKETVEMTAEGVEVPEGFSLSLHEATGYNSVTYLDYITLKKTADFSGKVEYYGDANGDGSVDISDVVAVVNYILNGGATGTFASENADVNTDGTVDISDVVGVVNMILNGEVKPRAVVAE